jgi:hypothetical protein
VRAPERYFGVNDRSASYNLIRVGHTSVAMEQTRPAID